MTVIFSVLLLDAAELSRTTMDIPAMAVNIDLESHIRIGKIVLFHRKQAGLTRMQLADIAGVGKTVVYDIEKGKETVRLYTLLKILNALNVKISLDGPMMGRYEAGENA